MLAVLVRFFGITFFLIAWDVYIWFAVFDAVFAVPQAILLWRTLARRPDVEALARGALGGSHASSSSA